MKTEKLFIQNRAGKKISILLDLVTDQKGLVFCMHGQGGFKEQSHIQIFTDVFLENTFSVVRFDARNSIGESEGEMEDATITSYYEDLEDVIEWSKKQPWYLEPFVLIGHSLGGICTALYAENYSDKVKALAPISTVVSGKLSYQTHTVKELQEWQKTGYQITESKSKPGLMKKLKWANMEDRLKYDLLEKVKNLTMPVLLIVGEYDTGTPPEHQKILYDRLPGHKKMHIIKEAPHTFRETEHLSEIKDVIDSWIKKEIL